MRVRAKMEVFYNGQNRSVGEEFETLNDMHGKVLMASGRVVAVIDEPQSEPEKRGRYKHRRMQVQE